MSGGNRIETAVVEICDKNINEPKTTAVTGFLCVLCVNVKKEVELVEEEVTKEPKKKSKKILHHITKSNNRKEEVRNVSRGRLCKRSVASV